MRDLCLGEKKVKDVHEILSKFTKGNENLDLILSNTNH